MITSAITLLLNNMPVDPGSGEYVPYYAVPTNIQALNAFQVQVTRHWLRALRRRGQRDRTNWKRMRAIEQRYLPKAEIRHPWPIMRFEASTRGRSPVR